MTWLRRRLWNSATLAISALALFGVAAWRTDWHKYPWRAVCAVAFSPDGRTLAAGMYDGRAFNENLKFRIGDLRQTVVLFDADTGASDRALEHVEHPGPFGGLPGTPLGKFVKFSPDGGVLAIAHWDGSVALWDPKSGRLVKTLRTESTRLRGVDFSRDGQFLAASDWLGFIWWRRSDFEQANRVFLPERSRSIAFSPNSEFVALGEHAGGHAVVWDFRRATLSQHIPAAEYEVFSVQFSSDGRSLAIGGDRSLILWDRREDKPRFKVDSPAILDLAIAPDGQSLATASRDGVRFWDTETGKQTGAIETAQTVWALAYSPKGDLLATGNCSGDVQVWDVRTRAMLWSARIPANAKIDWPWAISVAAGVTLLLLAGLSARFRFGDGVDAQSVEAERNSEVT